MAAQEARVQADVEEKFLPPKKKKLSERISWFFQSISLTTKLTAVLLILLTLGLSVAAFATNRLMWSYMLTRTDEQLMHQAQFVINNIGGLSDTDGQAPTNYFLQIRDQNNNILRTPLIPTMRDGTQSVPVLPANGKAGSIKMSSPVTVKSRVVSKGASSTGFRNSVLSNDSAAQAPWRVVKLQWFQQSTGQSGVFYFGISLSDAMDTARMISRYFLAADVCVLALGTVLGSIIISRELRPLKRIEKSAAKIASGDLSVRLPKLPETTEVGSLSASLNIMLARIEQSFAEEEATNAKMKQFVSDASHELRTPLATIHGYSELYLMQRDEPGALERANETIAHIETASTRMAALVNDLLSLARLDEGRGISATLPVRIDTLLHDSLDDLHALDPERPVKFGMMQLPQEKARGKKQGNQMVDLSAARFVECVPPELTSVADASRLRQVFTNIVGNIHRYTPADSLVEVSLNEVRAQMPYRQAGKLKATTQSYKQFCTAVAAAQQSGTGEKYLLIRFMDHGPGVKPEALDLMFERFYTADPSRAREKGGTGLGMAIAKAVMSAHCGFISATNTPGGGLTVNIVLPLRTEPTAGASAEKAAVEKASAERASIEKAHAEKSAASKSGGDAAGGAGAAVGAAATEAVAADGTDETAATAKTAENQRLHGSTQTDSSANSAGGEAGDGRLSAA